MPGPQYEVQGLRELRRDLKRAGDKDTIKQLKKATRPVNQLVLEAARTRASSPLMVRAAESLKAANASTPAVRLGGKPGDMGAEFGAQRDRPRTSKNGRNFTGYNQYEEWRGSGDTACYFLWPAIRDKTDEILAIYGDELTRVLKGEAQ